MCGVSEDSFLSIMAYKDVYLGNQKAKLITSNVVKKQIFLGVANCLTNELPTESDSMPVDLYINALLSVIRKHTILQNPHIMYCMRWKVHENTEKVCENTTPNKIVQNQCDFTESYVNCTWLIEKKTEKVYLLTQAFDDHVYDGTILGGWYVIDNKYYPPILWSIENFKLPIVQLSENLPANLDDSSVEDNDNDSPKNKSTESITYENTLVAYALEQLQKKEENTTDRLMGPDEFIKARLPRETNRETNCKFYTRMIYQLNSEIVGDIDKTYNLTVQFNKLLVNQWNSNTQLGLIDKPEINNCDMISWLNQIWAYECDLSKSHLNTTLYKPIPYPMLHRGLVEERIKSSPLIANTIDFNKKANFVIKYYGPDKPCVYNLLCLDEKSVDNNSNDDSDNNKLNVENNFTFENKFTLEIFDTAHIPTLECQQYTVCLLRKNSKTDNVIVRCVYETKLKKWIPIHYLKKPDTPIANKKDILQLMEE